MSSFLTSRCALPLKVLPPQNSSCISPVSGFLPSSYQLWKFYLGLELKHHHSTLMVVFLCTLIHSLAQWRCVLCFVSSKTPSKPPHLLLIALKFWSAQADSNPCNLIHLFAGLYGLVSSSICCDHLWSSSLLHFQNHSPILILHVLRPLMGTIREDIDSPFLKLWSLPVPP